MSLLLFDLPELTLDQLNSCALRLDALESWLGELPFAHPGICSQKLSCLLEEFNQLNFLPLRRLEWLNLLQPTAIKVIQGLDRGLDKGNYSQKEGHQAQTLQQELAKGYKRVVNDLLKLRDQLPPPILARSLLQALFISLEHSSAIILRSCLLSISAPPTSWPELNLLYNLACQSRLQHKTIKETAPLNCEQVYFQTLLLGLIQAENLRKDEVNQVYPLLAEWSQHISRLAYDHPQRLFVILADKDYVPERACLTNNKQATPALTNGAKSRSLALDTRMLAKTLQETLAKSSLSKRLIQHLAACLDELSTSLTPRIETQGAIPLVLGLRSVHFHMNNRRTLGTLLPANNLLPDTAAALEEANASNLSEEESNKHYPLYQTLQINASATGYCLFWEGEAINQLRTGELVAFKESNKTAWQAGLIRWVREVTGGQQLGVECLSGRMQPCAIKPIIKIGEPKAFMHGFLIPELQVLGITAGVITPLLPFREGQNVEISSNQGIEQAKLIELISCPGEFNHFRLEPLEQKELSLH